MSGLELIGGVSAAVGLAQTGFSLAKAIRETAKDYKDARDDIAGLARVIESTLSRVTEVKGLINDNDKTRVFSDNGLITIKNSFLDLERIVGDLIALLTTAGVSRDTRKTIRPEDVAVTRFQKVGWISLKSEVKDKKDELSNIQIDLTLAIICAQARSAVSPTVVAALRIRVADLEMERRQYASKGTGAGKPDMLHSSTNDSSSHSAVPIPDLSKEPPALSPTSSLPSAVPVPSADEAIPPGGNNEPGSADHVPLDDAREDTWLQVASPSRQQQNTDKWPQEGTQQRPAKDESSVHNHALDVSGAQYAHLLVVDGIDMFVTPLLPPKHPRRLSRAKPQVTAQVWAAFTPSLRKEIAASLDSMFRLPRGFGWHLAFARDAATPPKWKRILARILHLYENQDPQQSSRDGGRCYMVLFVSGRMFNNEAVSDGHPLQAPVDVQNYTYMEEDAVATVHSGRTPRVGTLANQSAIKDRHDDSGDDERRRMERQLEGEYLMEEYRSKQHATRDKTLEEEKRSLEILERRKRDELEEERRILEDLKRREFEAKEREHHHRAELEEMKAKEAAEKKEAEKRLETAPQHRIVEADLAPSEMEVIAVPVTKDRKQRRTSKTPERTAEEETQLFNDAMLRFTGRML